jgi:hypothetical protein
MAEESTTPDLVEMTRRSFEAGSRHDIDASRDSLYMTGSPSACSANACAAPRTLT